MHIISLILRYWLVKNKSTVTQYRYKHLLFLFIYLLLPCQISAQTNVLQEIKNAVTEYVTQNLNPEKGESEIAEIRLDPRLNLPTCSMKLMSFLPSGRKLSGNTTIGVRCDGDKPWAVYVPLQIRLLQDIIVTKHSISRNTPLMESDLIIEKRDISNLRDTPLSDISHILGNISRRNLSAGTILSTTMLIAPKVIKRGEQVSILAKAPGMSISTTGIALTDGVEGELINVRNLLTKKVILGLVIEPGSVQVQL